MTSNRVRSSPISLAVVALVLALTLVGSARTVFAEAPAKFKGEGAYAHAYSYNDGCSWLYVHVGRDGTKTSPQTFLIYDIYDSCTQTTVAAGQGMIPSAAFKTTGKIATVNVQPTTVPGFWTLGQTGAVSLTFTADGIYRTTSSGHTRTEYFNRLIQWHGSSSSTTATISGTVVGIAANMQGEMGESRGKSIEIVRGR